MLIKNVVDCFVLSGVDEEDRPPLKKELMDVFKSQFVETPYAETTMRYVKTTLEARLKEMGAYNFLEESGR